MPAAELLVATPRLRDPNFKRTVVLLLDHDDDGALGIVLNRPTLLCVETVLGSWASAVSDPGVVYAGGPVATDSALAVAVPIGAGPHKGYQPLGDTPTGFGLLDLDVEPTETVPSLVGVRIFAGYAGWGAQQLEAEIVEGSWYVVASVPTDVLNPEPADLWREVLRRQPGELAYVANFPSDPALN